MKKCIPDGKTPRPELKWRRDQLVQLYLSTMWDKGTQSFILRFLRLRFHEVHYLFKFAFDKESAPKLSSVFDDSKTPQTIIRAIWHVVCQIGYVTGVCTRCTPKYAQLNPTRDITGHQGKDENVYRVPEIA